MARASSKSPPAERPEGEEKTVRKNITMPRSAFKLIKSLQSRGYKHDVGLNDSEVLRAGLKALWEMSDKQFDKVVSSVVRLRRGRRSASEEES
ncbi:MAG TPA: hypothetical protein VEX70_10550 [Pyrinomonadaceae bacterium]|nr:hypothetical protein [Pyrinomonadaceae bacterium]